MDAYEVLGLTRGADATQVRKAYHALAKRWHPDRHRGLPTEYEAHERMAEINRAYVELRNSAPETRRPAADERNRTYDDARMMREARSLAAEGKFAEAMAALRQCRLRSSEWYKLMGRCQAETGDAQGAEDSLRWAARRDRSKRRQRRRSFSLWRRAARWIRSLLRFG